MRLNKVLIPSIKAYLRRFPLLVQLDRRIVWRRIARQNGIELSYYDRWIDVRRENKCIRISNAHEVYIEDIINYFNYYYEAVRPAQVCGTQVVDYSTPRFHEVVGYERHPIYFPSFAEPLVTTKQYLGFANLKPGSVVFDMGAYSGLTSIMFKELVGPSGVVLALEADVQNFEAARKNLLLYSGISGNEVALMHGALWCHNEGVEFSSEGNMGSSATSILGSERGRLQVVPSFTLTTLAKDLNVAHVDFIKCDIEGAETVVFDDSEFFKSYRPRIIVEPHMVDGTLSSSKVRSALSMYGYKLREISQIGVGLPLLECYPSERWTDGLI